MVVLFYFIYFFFFIVIMILFHWLAADKKAAPSGPSINPRINASAVVAMAEQELRQNRTGDVLKSILKSTSSKA